MKEYVGIMVGKLVFNGIKKGKTYYENLSFYEEAGEKYNLIPCYFRFDDINPGISTITAYVREEDGTFALASIPKPKIIHNRILTGKVSSKRKLKRLKKEGITFINEKNRFKKLRIYEILKKDPKLLPNLPETVKISEENLKEMMNKYNELIIKPNSGSLGSGISKLSKVNENEWEFSYFQKKVMVKKSFSSKMPLELKRLLNNPRIIIQERIPLAKSKGGIFDMRVSVQKNDIGEWQVSGIVGKVANNDKFITNVAKGATCYPLNELLKDLPHLDREKVNNDIKCLSLRIAKQLERELPPMTDLGLDIGLTHEGIPKFIECNGRDLRVTFRNAKMDKEWKETHTTPIGYVKYLIQTKTKN
ncbi:YheC/YheD family endospore coat-associated protein [Metabacillus schmidteae]|uniref:YheC/YheD family endospore coat-associated protein n=1 Tax=Metabacillus schmidteae TaxID=2730405 RepID=UPI00158CAF0F|nr:YheC/YheD family protein [Metabacillus schmidteae]